MKTTTSKTSDNQEAQFEYKCRRCGEIYSNIDCSVELANTLLTSAAYDLSHLKLTQYKIHTHEVHSCRDGGRGIADLQGYRVVG